MVAAYDAENISTFRNRADENNNEIALRDEAYSPSRPFQFFT